MNELFNSQIITVMLDRIASIPDSSDIDQVMNYIVDIIRDEGNFYYVSLFLVDTAREWAVFRSGNEEYREQFLSKEFKFHLGSSSIVGQAVVENDLQIFDYDREGSFMSPLLPDTRWELALPLNAGGDVIGVLKIEGTDIDSFGYEEAKPIQRVADSVAEKLADTIAAGLRLGDNDLEENNIPTFPASAAIATGKLSRETIEINGNQLPLKLVDLIERGLWNLPEELEEKEYLDTIYKGLRSLELYGIGNMQRETQGLLAQCTSGEFPEMTKYFLGKPDGQYPPGDIDFFKAIIIADLGTDSPPIALDYRKDKNDPSVMILHICRRDNEFVTRWLKIADTFEEFWDAIKVKR